MRDFTALGGIAVLTLISIGAIGYLVVDGKRRAALAVAVAVSGGLLISTFVKMGIDRARPDIVPHGSYVSTASFPSGHSMMAAVVYLTLAAMIARLRPRWRVRVYLLLAACSWAPAASISGFTGRPTCSPAGLCVGPRGQSVCWIVMLRLQRGGEVERQDEQ